MATTSAPLARKPKAPRVGRACDACRRRKQKCEGGTTEQPCQNCRQMGAMCTFEQNAPPRRSASKGYVEQLEQRVEHMESLLRNLSIHLPQSGPDGRRPDMLSTGNSPGAADHDRSSPSEDFSPSGSGFTTNSRNAVEIFEREEDPRLLGEILIKEHHIGSSSAIHMTTSLRAYQTTDEMKKKFAGVQAEILPGPQPMIVETSKWYAERRQLTDLPPPDLAAKLIDGYFQNVNTLIPLLHRPSFDRACLAGLATSDTAFRDLAFMVYALGSRFVDDDRIPEASVTEYPGMAAQTRGWLYFLAATAYRPTIWLGASLFDVQAATLGAVWIMGGSGPPAWWMAIGDALRRAVDIGMHREHMLRWRSSPLEDQLRKRAFYTLLTYDRLTSTGVGRPFFMQTHDYDVQPPLDITDAALDDWNLQGLETPPPPPETSTPMTGFLSLLRLLLIMYKTVTALYGPQQVINATAVVSELDSCLNEWLEGVPEHLRWNSRNVNTKWTSQMAFINSTYYFTQILVHRNFLTPTRSLGPNFPSLAICSNAARSTSHIYNRLLEMDLLKPAFIYLPYQAAATVMALLVNVFATHARVGTLTPSALDDVRKTIAAIVDMKPYCWIAGKASYFAEKLASIVPTSEPSRKRAASSLPVDGPILRHSLEPSSSSSGSPDTDTPSPASQSNTAVNASLHKRRRQDEPSALPFTTKDLSLPTFEGLATFQTFGIDRQSDTRLSEQQATFAVVAPELFPTFDYNGFPAFADTSQGFTAGAQMDGEQPTDWLNFFENADDDLFSFLARSPNIDSGLGSFSDDLSSQSIANYPAVANVDLSSLGIPFSSS